MFNKKGQQEVSMGTVLLIIIGVIAVVLIVVSVTGGFDYLSGLFEQKTGDLTVFTAACTTYSQGELYNDYCREFREGEVLGVSGFFNCQYEPFQADIKKDGVVLDCSRYGKYTSADSSATEYCTQTRTAEGKEFNPEMIVNGKSCKVNGVNVLPA